MLLLGVLGGILSSDFVYSYYCCNGYTIQQFKKKVIMARCFYPIAWQACMLRFWKGKGTKAFTLWQRAPYEEIVNFYWSISRQGHQGNGKGQRRQSPSLPPWSIRPGFIHDCAFHCICDPTWQKEEDKSLRETFRSPFFVLATHAK